MGFELELDENAAEGIKRIILERVDYVHELMVNPNPTREKAVHEARKSFKRIRAALRLVRDGTGEAWYREQNMFIRDTSRLLAPVRDSAVLVEVLDGLTAEYADVVPPETFDSIRAKLVGRSERIISELLDEKDVLSEAAWQMKQFRPVIAAMPVRSKGFDTFAAGLQRVYRQGRQAMRSALEDPDDPVKFHEWRKRVKYLWYHMDILQQAWPLMLSDTANELHLASDFLGDAHDLVELKETILGDPVFLENEPNLVTLLALADRRRRELEEASWTLGQRLYSEKPRDFVARIRSYWDAWQADQPATREALQSALANKALAKSEPVKARGLLSTREAAQRTGKTVREIRASIRRGELEAVKIGRVWVIEGSQLSAVGRR